MYSLQQFFRLPGLRLHQDAFPLSMDVPLGSSPSAPYPGIPVPPSTVLHTLPAVAAVLQSHLFILGHSEVIHYSFFALATPHGL